MCSVTLCGALPLGVFDEMREAIEEGFPSFKVFTTDVLPPHPQRPSFRLDFGRIEMAMTRAARHGGLMVVHAEDDVEVPVVAQRHVGHGADGHTREQHLLPGLEVLPPGEPRVERIAGRQPAAHEPESAEQRDRRRHREKDADEDFVATFHVCR